MRLKKLNRVVFPAALVLALGASAFSVEAGQDGRRPNRNGGDGSSPQGGRGEQARQRPSAPQQQRPAGPAPQQPRTGPSQQQPRAGTVQEQRRGPVYVAPRRGPVYIAPRIAPRRYYRPGPGLSVYFAFGSGYRYGSPYYGPVYGYSVPSGAYGPRHYYGDLRLEVRPRDAAVYVDGYYTGIVDDFDGTFQRLTLEAGPHRVEIEAPGYETRVYDVYVDPTRTLDLHGDLVPERP